MDKKTYIELLETDVDVHAQQFAGALFAEFASGIVQHVEGHADLQAMLGEHPDVSEDDVKNILVPAFLTQSFKHIEEIARTHKLLWSDVFWRNLRDQYETEGRIEP